jgi:hypothetical protein
MKNFSKFILALLFNLVAAVSIGAAASVPPLAIFGGGIALSALGGASGIQMAVQKEIWMNSIVEGLFADNTFLSKAFNADEFVVQGKTVHIPNAGAASGVVKNRSSFPATVTSREDVDLTFDLDEFTTDPIKIPNADTVELSYNKRESVLKTDKAKLIEEVSNDFIYKWSPASANVIRTTGSAVVAHTPAATGNRKALTAADVKAAMVQMNKDDVPQVGRYLLLDADMHSQLLDDLSSKQLDAFLALADLKNGIVGQLYGFNVMMRSKAARYTGSLTAKAWTTAGAATDLAAALAWHENSICRALGQSKMFDSVDDPTYYADIYSFLVRAGGRPMRSDVKGLLAIVEDTAA